LKLSQILGCQLLGGAANLTKVERESDRQPREDEKKLLTLG
jgi:hypothetical protein